MYPFSIWILLSTVVLLAYFFSKPQEVKLRDGVILRERQTYLFIIIIITVILIYFSSQVTANDIFAYRVMFHRVNINDSWSTLIIDGIGNNPLFILIEIFFIKYISHSTADFQILVAIITQIGFMLFFKRYTTSLSMTLYFFITSGLFFFSSVSWKQSLAMALALAFFPIIQNKKYIIYYGILFILMFIHPYVITFAIFPFLINNKVWTKKNVIILGGMWVAGLLLTQILGTTLEVTENFIGDEFDASYFNEDTGVSYQRVIFFAIVPILSLLYRRNIDEHPYPLMNGFIQMSVISFGFMLMSMYGGATLIGRMGVYFEPFTYIALPYILIYALPSNSKKVIMFCIFAIFLIFFYISQLKYANYVTQ